MKILDRYVLVTFFKNYLISFLVLIGLYIALDMVFNFDDLIEPPKAMAASLPVTQIILDIAGYYAYQTPAIFVYLSGIIAVVGAAFTLMRLSRFNELTAILAAGVPLLRVAVPIVAAGVALNGVLILDQEVFIPRIMFKIVRSHEEMHIASPKSFAIQMMRDDHNGLLTAASYTPPGDGRPAKMDYLDVVERDEQLRPRGHLQADMAVYDPHAKLWRLTHGQHVSILQPQPAGRQQPLAMDAYQSDINPDEIALWRGGEYVQLLATSRINQLLARPKSYGTENLLRVKNFRIAQPIGNVILLLLAVPTVLTRQPGQLKSAAVKCLFLCGACMGCTFLAYQLAANPPSPEWTTRWPAAMAWMPIFIFGPLAVWLLDRVKS
jgi:lipopolysaccharide export system permease protein